MVEMTQPSTQCRTQTTFSLLQIAPASSAFQLPLLHGAITKKGRNKCPQNTEMHIPLSVYMHEVLGFCQVLYLHFVTCEKIHCKYLSLTGIFIILDFCDSPARDSGTIAFKCAAPAPCKWNKRICSSPGLWGVPNDLYGLGDLGTSPS